MSEPTTLVLDPTSEVGAKFAAPLVSVIKAAIKVENSREMFEAYVEAYGVTREEVALHANALAVLTYPNAEPVQKKNGKRTAYGNAVQAAGAMLRKALPQTEAEPKVTDWLALLDTAVKNALDNGHGADEVSIRVSNLVDEYVNAGDPSALSLVS